MFEAIILGIVQGLTEFIPVSSSGHLILFRDLFGFGLEGTLWFDALLQLATTLSIVVYFRKDIWKLVCDFCLLIFRKPLDQASKNYIYAIIIATIPAVIFGLLLEDVMDTLFRDTHLVAGTLVVGALVLLYAEKRTRQVVVQKKVGEMRWWQALVIGLFQSLALIPGMSRSGMSISGGLFMGLQRVEATRFAFLMAFPILFGSGMKKLLDVWSGGVGPVDTGAIAIGCLVSFAVGLLAIHFLITFLNKHTLNVFAWYRIVLAVVLIGVLL